MATEQQKFELLISVLTQGIQTASSQLTAVQKGLSGSAEDSRELRGDFERLRAVAGTLVGAFQAVNQGVRAAGDTSATTALKYERLMEAVREVASQLNKAEAEYAANSQKSQELQQALERLRTAQTGVIDKLKDTPRGEAYDKLRQEAATLKEEIERTEKALVEQSKAMADAEKQAGSLAAQQQKLVEVLRNEQAAFVDASNAAGQVNLQDVGQGIESVGRALENAGTMVAAFLTVPIVGLSAAAGKFSSEFEAAMLKVRAKSGATRQEMKALEAQALELGSKSKFGAKEVAEGQTDLAAAGLNVKQVLQALPDVLNLAVAGELEMGRAAEIATDTMNQFGYEAKDVGKIADILVKAADSSSISVEQLGYTFKYAGPLAKTAGQSLEEMAAAAVILGNSGIKGETAGTVLRGSLAALIDPSKEAEKTIQRLGITANDSSGKLLPLNQIILQLEQSGATTADVMKIFGQEAGNGMVTLLSKGSASLREMTGTMQNAGGATSTVAKVLGSGVMAQFQTLANGIEVVFIKIGQGLAPVLQPVLTFLTGTVMPILQRIADWFVAADPQIKAVIVVISGILAAIGPVVVVFGAIITALGGLVTSIGALVAAGATIKIVGLVIAGLAVILAEFIVVAGAWYLAIKTNFAGVRDVIVAVMNQAKGYIDIALTEITGFWNANSEKIIYALRLIVAYWDSLLKPVVAQAGKFIQFVLSNAAEYVAFAVRLISNAFMLVVNLLNGDLAGAWQNVKNIVATAAMFMANRVIDAANLIIENINRVIGWLGIAIPKLEKFNLLAGESKGQPSPGQRPLEMKPGHGGQSAAGFISGLSQNQKPGVKDPQKQPSGGGGGGGGGSETFITQLLQSAQLLKQINEAEFARLKQNADDAARDALDALEREQRGVEASYNARLISATTYYQQIANLRDASAAVEIAKLDETLSLERDKFEELEKAKAQLEAAPAKGKEDSKKQIDALRELTSQMTESANRIKGLEKEIERAKQKRADVNEESQRKINEGLRQEQEEIEELQRQYLELTGDDFANRRMSINKQADAELEKIRKGLSGQVSAGVDGEDPSAAQAAVEALDAAERAKLNTIQQTRAVKLAQVELDQRMAAIAEIQNRLKQDEENLDREALRLAISQYEVEARKKAMREGAADAIERELAAMRQLIATNPGLNNASNRRAVEGTQRNIDDLRFSVSSLQQDVQQRGVQAFEGLFQGIMSGSQSAGQVFMGFVSSVLGGISQMISKLLALWLVQKLVGLAMGFMGGGGAGSLGGKGLGSLGLPLKEFGGNVSKGEAVVVGERRPEIFVPGSDGYIFPSMQDLLRRATPRGMNDSGLRVPQGLAGMGMAGAAAATNEFLIATLFEPKTLARLMKSRPVKDAIINVVTGAPNTVRKATLGG
jgi:TP901 family phage tail tape measure protein